MTAIRWIASLALLLLSLVLSARASALQVVDASDGETLVARMSQKELTRIAVSGARIRKVTGNGGEFLLEKDDDRGQIFVKPAQNTVTKPINLFLTTDSATYALLLQPVDLPAESIVIRPRLKDTVSTTTPRSSAYIRQLKDLIFLLANDVLPRDADVREVSREVGLWPNVRFVLTRIHLSQGLVAEKYLLTNRGTGALMLSEPLFYKRGVAAVSVESSSLETGGSTHVFVIRERRHDE